MERIKRERNFLMKEKQIQKCGDKLAHQKSPQISLYACTGNGKKNKENPNGETDDILKEA